MFLRISDIDKLFGGLKTLESRLNRLPSRFETPWGQGFNWSVEDGNPRTNLYDNGEYFEIRAEVPGMDKGGLEVKIQGNYLEISGSRNLNAPKGYKIQNTERDRVTVSRSLTLPVDVDAAKASAVLKDGILYLKLPKAQAVKPQKITIG